MCIRDSSVTVPEPGSQFDLGSAEVQILGPQKEYEEPNNTSLVLRVVFGETSFLFTGDAEREAEQDMIDAGVSLSSTVLKVGHHGRCLLYTSTQRERTVLKSIRGFSASRTKTT